MFIKKTLRFSNLKTRAAMNTKISLFICCVEPIIYLLLFNLHDCTFKVFNANFSKITLFLREKSKVQSNSQYLQQILLPCFLRPVQFCFRIFWYSNMIITFTYPFCFCYGYFLRQVSLQLIWFNEHNIITYLIGYSCLAISVVVSR